MLTDFGAGMNKMEMENKFKCTICYEKYASLKDLEGHWAVHFRHYGAPEDRKATESPERNTERSRQELNRCDQCEFKTRLRFALKMHVRKTHVEHLDVEESKHDDSNDSHRDDKINYVSVKGTKEMSVLECSICGIKNASRRNLLRHMKVVHDNIKPYHCNLCDFKVCQRMNLEKHIKHVHIRLKDQQCPKCKFATCNKAYLKKTHQTSS